ncbi:MAG: hypothetical protein H6719_30805 [Sandaracinaceae bacterium]|nr:hypothetical protein [Sandaracinaceae bacterium]
MRRLLLIGLMLGLGAALGLAQRAFAEGACVNDLPAVAELELASVSIDGATASLEGVPATAALEQPPHDSPFADPYPSLVIGGNTHPLMEAP